MKQVDIGYVGAQRYFQDFTSPAHSRFIKVKSRENAIENAKTIWELRDWFWRDTHPGVDIRGAPQLAAFDQQLLKECPELGLIRDIAESAKHGGQLGRGSVVVKEITGSGGGGIEYTTGPLGTYEGPPPCTLEVHLLDGSSRPLPEVLRAAMDFWVRKLA